MSIVAEVIKIISNDHALNPDTDFCKCGKSCKLQSGHEFSFVSLVANDVFTQICHKRSNCVFHQWVYIPNLKAENIVGYDLSLGYFASNVRVRTMHKLIMEPWCDEPTTWSLNNSTNDVQHFHTFREASQRDHSGIRYYIILHFCYCIHEFRRMGALGPYQENELIIPSMSSPLRTIIIDLNDLFSNTRDVPVENNMNIQYVRKSKVIEKATFDEWFKYNYDYTIHHCFAQDPSMDLQIINYKTWVENTAAFLTDNI